MEILRERPDYFPLLMEFWAYAIREPALRERLAERFAALRLASGRLFMEAAERHGQPPHVEAGEFVGLLINALGNGLAFEKLVDPQAVPDALFGDMLTLIFKAFEALIREDPSAVDPQNAITSQEPATTSRKSATSQKNATTFTAQKPATKRKGAKNG